MTIEKSKQELENLNNYLVKVMDWQTKSNKSLAISGTSEQKRKWTDSMNQSIDECRKYLLVNDSFEKIWLSTGNGTWEAAEEGFCIARFEYEVDKVYKLLNRKIHNLTCYILCKECKDSNSDVRFFIKNQKYDFLNQGREIKRFVINEVFEDKVTGYDKENTDLESNLDNTFLMEEIRFFEGTYISKLQEGAD